MKFTKIFIFSLVAMLLLAACGGEEAKSPPPEIDGPALVMFYTDN